MLPSDLFSCSESTHVSSRPKAWLRGKRVNALVWVEVYSRSGFGTTYGAERWKTVTCAASGWMPGTNWIALAPVPSTAIRLPRRSTSCSHSAEWKAGPSKVPIPGQVRDGRPGQLTHRSDQHVGLEVLAGGGGQVPERAASSYAASVTSTPVRTRSSTPSSPAVRSM